MNVALSEDAAHDGGRLLAIVDNQVRAVARSEGEATVHDSRLLHAVSRITTGCRYSLILFFNSTADSALEAAAAEKAFTRFEATLEPAELRALQAELRELEAPSHQDLEHAKAALEAYKARMDQCTAEMIVARRAERENSVISTATAASNEAAVQRREHAESALKRQQLATTRAGERVRAMQEEGSAARRQIRARLMADHAECGLDNLLQTAAALMASKGRVKGSTITPALLRDMLKGASPELSAGLQTRATAAKYNASPEKSIAKCATDFSLQSLAVHSPCLNDDSNGGDVVAESTAAPSGGRHEAGAWRRIDVPPACVRNWLTPDPWLDRSGGNHAPGESSSM